LTTSPARSAAMRARRSAAASTSGQVNCSPHERRIPNPKLNQHGLQTYLDDEAGT
jgi:hypothetical protein